MPDRKPDPDFEPDYDVADTEPDESTPADGPEIADPDPDDMVQADYEPGPDVEYEEAPQGEAVAVPSGLRATPNKAFAFALGRPVVPASQQQAHPVVWRGVLKERHPATGLVQRVPVYRLADGHWDCYREEELQAA